MLEAELEVELGYVKEDKKNNQTDFQVSSWD